MLPFAVLQWLVVCFARFLPSIKTRVVRLVAALTLAAGMFGTEMAQFHVYRSVTGIHGNLAHDNLFLTTILVLGTNIVSICIIFQGANVLRRKEKNQEAAGGKEPPILEALEKPVQTVAETIKFLRTVCLAHLVSMILYFIAGEVAVPRGHSLDRIFQTTIEIVGAAILGAAFVVRSKMIGPALGVLQMRPNDGVSLSRLRAGSITSYFWWPRRA